MPKFYVTTAIPYVNAAPHIGHALEFTQTDVIARFHKLLGDEVLLLTGSDENSLKNVKAAEELNISTHALVGKNAKLFRELAEKMGLSFDVFLRSSIKEDHWGGVNELWELCKKNGDMYRKVYSGLYCVGCELFYKESELIDGKCSIHKTKPEKVDEENYFFKLSSYQKRLEKLIESEKLKIYPQTRRNETLGFIKMGLEDFSISRSVERARGWGVPVPDDPSQIMYVWLDALAIYLTGIGFGTDKKKYDRWWPANLHVIGKDILKFHTVYWPAILMSAGLKTPKSVSVHGFLTVNGNKMSKTTGNVVDPLELLKKYTADELRYYLIRDIPTFNDGDFSEKELKDRTNKELLGDLGNLLNRVVTLAANSGLNEFSGTNELEKNLKLEQIINELLNLNLQNGLNQIMDFVRCCNAYVNEKAPWKLKGKELESVLYNLLEALRISAILLSPFIPETSQLLAAGIGTKISSINECRYRERFVGKIKKGGLLFKKVE